jgi:hypothetical protein
MSSLFTTIPDKKFDFNIERIIEMLIINNINKCLDTDTLIKVVSQCIFTVKTSDYYNITSNDNLRKISKNYCINESKFGRYVINEVKISHPISLLDLSIWEDIIDYYCGFVRSSIYVIDKEAVSSNRSAVFKMTVESWDSPFLTENDRYFAWRIHCMDNKNEYHKIFR